MDFDMDADLDGLTDSVPAVPSAVPEHAQPAPAGGVAVDEFGLAELGQ